MFLILLFILIFSFSLLFKRQKEEKGKKRSKDEIRQNKEIPTFLMMTRRGGGKPSSPHLWDKDTTRKGHALLAASNWDDTTGRDVPLLAASKRKRYGEEEYASSPRVVVLCSHQ